MNFDAILGELYELESQLNTTQTELSRTIATPHGVPLAPPHAHVPPPPAGFQDGDDAQGEVQAANERVSH